MITLPITIDCLYDPAFVPVRDSKGTCTNIDEYNLKNVPVIAEVLTVHFNKNTMRVRFTWNGSSMTMDVSAQPFMDAYLIVPKDKQ